MTVMTDASVTGSGFMARSPLTKQIGRLRVFNVFPLAPNGSGLAVG